LIQVVVPHPIEWNNVDKTNVGGVVSLTRKKIVLIDHMPKLPTLIPANHVPIVIRMGMITKGKLE
jgi:hypothetical protein